MKPGTCNSSSYNISLIVKILKKFKKIQNIKIKVLIRFDKDTPPIILKTLKFLFKFQYKMSVLYLHPEVRF